MCVAQTMSVEHPTQSRHRWEEYGVNSAGRDVQQSREKREAKLPKKRGTQWVPKLYSRRHLLFSDYAQSGTQIVTPGSDSSSLIPPSWPLIHINDASREMSGPASGSPPVSTELDY